MKSIPSLLSLLFFVALGTAAPHELQLSLEVRPGFDIDLSAQRLIEFNDHQRVWMTELEKVSNFQGYTICIFLWFLDSNQSSWYQVLRCVRAILLSQPLVQFSLSTDTQDLETFSQLSANKREIFNAPVTWHHSTG